MRNDIVLMLLAISPLVAHGDYVSSASNVAEYRVYDKSIKAVPLKGERLVLYYVRTETTPKLDMYGNQAASISAYQSLFDCKSKYWSNRDNENTPFSSGSWTLPDSLGRAGGEYACSNAYQKK